MTVSLLLRRPGVSEPHFGRLGRKVALVAMLAGLVTSCGSTPQTFAARAPAGQVALAFARDLFSGRLDQAASLVLPGEASGFNVMVALIKRNVTQQRGLAVGSITMKGTDRRGGTDRDNLLWTHETSSELCDKFRPSLGSTSVSRVGAAKRGALVHLFPGLTAFKRRKNEDFQRGA